MINRFNKCSKADGQITDDETAFLVYYAGQAGIPVTEATTIIKSFEETEHHWFSPGNKLQQEQFGVDLVTMALVDGNLSDREVDKCKSICMRMGLSEAIIDLYYIDESE